MTGEELTARFIEQSSSKALGWILEQHCEIQWGNDLLTIVFKGNHRMAKELLYEDDTVRTIQGLVNKVTNRHYAIRITDEQDKEYGLPAVVDEPHETPDPVEITPPLQQIVHPHEIHNQCEVINSNTTLFTWRDLKFRSQSEVRIAEALDQQGVMFLPNCKARIGQLSRVTREADFLICHQGRWGMLEVDGEPWHPPARTVEDHRRDRLFKEHGIQLVEHFDASECYQNPDFVVRRFLALLEQTE